MLCAYEFKKNGTEISREKFQKFLKFLNFRKVNHSAENSGNSGMKIKWTGNFQEKNGLAIPHEVVLFYGNYANSQVSIDRFHCHAIKKINQKPSGGKN